MTALARAWIVGIGALLLCSCQGTPQQSVSYLQIETAAMQLLRQAILVQTAADAVADNIAAAAVNTNPANNAANNTSTNITSANIADSHAAALNLCRQWQQGHWQLVLGANEFYRSSLRNQVLAYKGENISPAAFNLYRSERALAMAEVRRLYRRSGAAALCNPARLQLDIEPRVAKELLAYASRDKNPVAPGSKVPTLAGDRDLKAAPGRSFFTLERQLSSSACPQPQLYVLFNQWPEEAYIGVCGKQHRLLLCDWGNCSSPESSSESSPDSSSTSQSN